MADKEKLYKAIRDFEFWSHPSSASDSTPATVGDVNKLIKNIAVVLKTFVDELDEKE